MLYNSKLAINSLKNGNPHPHRKKILELDLIVNNIYKN